jgi:MFS family permease
MQAVLRNRSLWIIGLAESISGIGTWITMMALFALVMFDGGGTVLHSSGIMLAGLAPMLLMGPAAGWLADRFDRKRLMIASQILTALPVVGLMLTGDTLLIYPLLALHTVFAAVMMPARQASVPQLVARQDLTQANALLQQLGGYVKIAAPILGGVIVAALGPQRAMLLDLVTFGVAALVLMLLPALPPVTPAPTESDESTTKPAGQSVWQVLRTSPELQTLFVVIFLGVLVIMGFDVLSSIAVRDMLQADERLFGVLIGLVGLGSVFAGLGLMFRKRKVDPWQDVILGLTLLATLPLTIALGTRLADPLTIRWLVAAGAFIGGIGNGLIVIQISTLLQLLSPEALLGRLSGLFQSTIAAAQLITIVLTPLIVPAFLSIGAFFGWSTLMLGLVVLYTTVTVRRQARATARPLPVEEGVAPSPGRLS